VIETAFWGLLMAPVGGAMPDPAGKSTAGEAAIDLSPLTIYTFSRDH
jgi:hypothetical protein